MDEEDTRHTYLRMINSRISSVYEQLHLLTEHVEALKTVMERHDRMDAEERTAQRNLSTPHSLEEDLASDE